MAQEVEVENAADGKKFVRKHWKMIAVFAAAAILAVIGAVYVFRWFVSDAQSTGLVPATLNLWTMDNLVSFILYAIFYELILIGIPVAISAILGWQWWKRLPDEEKKENLFGQSSRSRRAGGAISPLLFIAFAIKVYVDGNWNTPIASFTVNYVADSTITILVWTAAIFAIPAAIALIWWIHHDTNKKP